MMVLKSSLKHFPTLIPFVQITRWQRGLKGWFLRDCIIVNWYFSISNIAHHLWTLDVQGGLWLIGWYYPIIITYIIRYFCSQNNLTDPYGGYQQASLLFVYSSVFKMKQDYGHQTNKTQTLSEICHSMQNMKIDIGTSGKDVLFHFWKQIHIYSNQILKQSAYFNFQSGLFWKKYILLGDIQKYMIQIEEKQCYNPVNPFVRGPRNLQNMNLGLKWNIFQFKI